MKSFIPPPEPGKDGVVRLPEGASHHDYAFERGARVLFEDGRVWRLGQTWMPEGGPIGGTKRNPRKSPPEKEVASTPAKEVESVEATEKVDSETVDKRQEVSVAETAEKEKSKSTARKGGAKGKEKASTNGGERRERGVLEGDVLSVIEDHEGGKVDLPEGKNLTPHLIAKEIASRKPKEKAPSTGAVTNIVKKLYDAGYILVHQKPFAVKSISAKGKKQGYDDVIQKYEEKRKKERQAKREANKS